MTLALHTYSVSEGKCMWTQDDVCKLPESIQIEHEKTVYWIYISAEKLTCFLCKEEGHLAKYCKNVEVNTPTVTPTYSQSANIQIQIPRSKTEIPQTKATEQLENLPSKEETETNQVKTPEINIFKRPLTISTHTAEITDSDNSTPGEGDKREKTESQGPIKEKRNKTRPKKKKTKIQEETVDIKQKLEKARHFFELNDVTPTVDFNNLVEFLTETYGNPNTFYIASNYSQDIPKITDMLKRVYDHVEDRALKCRITRIIKKLQNPMDHTNVSEELSSSEE